MGVVDIPRVCFLSAFREMGFTLVLNEIVTLSINHSSSMRAALLPTVMAFSISISLPTATALHREDPQASIS
jgi:hypothetical protein